MLVLGLNGGMTGSLGAEQEPEQLGEHPAAYHDAAAVLLEDGCVVAAIEQERLDRIKHSNKFPADALRFCLRERGIRLGDLDAVAYYVSRSAYAWTLRDLALTQASLGIPPIETSPTEFLRQTFARAIGDELPVDRLRFVKHHVAHAASAFWPSGFERALIVTLDGVGDRESGSISVGEGNDLRLLESLSEANSLGLLYASVIRVMGFKMFDEYKAMGLAPYGRPEVYRHLLNKLYELHEGGRYVLHLNRVGVLTQRISLRRKGEPFTQEHKDLAASLQETLEAIVFHVVEHHLRATGLRDLCLAGGVAHNCTLNGKLRASALLDRVFVQPAAHDAGCALGAAIVVHRQLAPSTPIAPLRSVYFGSELEETSALETRCAAWGDFIEARRSDDVVEEAAQLLADGTILGWTQGRSEFGPRALGNRSILADARPEENKTIINAMVKKREGFRPFAPAVAQEAARTYFDIPGDADIPFMTFVVAVQPSQRSVLGAICHVDGSARVQTVTPGQNERFWSLITKFGQRTGVPVLLNTSFNNNAEPIVDSAEDAIVAYLTTELHLLVLGDLIVQRRPFARRAITRLHVSLPAHICLSEVRRHATRTFELRRMSSEPSGTIALSEAAYALLSAATGATTIDAILKAPASDEVVEELWSLWEKRVIVLRPGSRS